MSEAVATQTNVWRATLALLRDRDLHRGLGHAALWGALTGPLVSFLISGGLNDPAAWLTEVGSRWQLFIWALPLIGCTWATVLTLVMSFYRWVVIPRIGTQLSPARQFLAIAAWGFGLGFIALLAIHGFLEGIFGIRAIIGPSVASSAAIVGLVGIVIGNLFHLSHLSHLRLRQEEARRKELERFRVESELMSLNMRIRPHFFFNALNTLASLMDKDTEAAQEFLVDLADLFRLSFAHGREHHTATWAAERELLTRYLDLERRRFGDRLTTALEVHAPDQASFPAFLLQPLVENAVHHGIARLETPGEIKVIGDLTGNTWTIEIGNSTRGRAQIAYPTGHALAQIRERLALMHGKLSVDSRDGWFSVKLTWDTEEP